MVYLKAALIGVVTGLLGIVIANVVPFLLVLVVARMFISIVSSGSGGIGAVSSGIPSVLTVVGGLGGFGVGFFLSLRRSRRAIQ